MVSVHCTISNRYYNRITITCSLKLVASYKSMAPFLPPALCHLHSIMFEFCYIQLPSGCARVTCTLELNISCTVNVAIPISLVGLSQVQYSSGLGHTLDTHAVGSCVFHRYIIAQWVWLFAFYFYFYLFIPFVSVCNILTWLINCTLFHFSFVTHLTVSYCYKLTIWFFRYYCPQVQVKTQR